MRSFLSKYGLALLAVVVACMLPAIASAMGIAHTGSVDALRFAPLALAGSINDTTKQDSNSLFVLDTVRAMYNKLLGDFTYFALNGVMSTTIATQPGCATATVTSQVKTANATVLINAGVAKALAATDNFWTLTGAVQAASTFRRYLLCADASGTASVIQSLDSLVSAAACRWVALPANGVAIVGVLTVATDASHTFTPGTTLLGAAGITATYIDGWDISVPLATLVSP